MVIDKIASHYYGPLHSETQRQYDRLYSPLARRLATTAPSSRLQQGPQSATDVLPLSQEQQARQRFGQITRLRILSHNGNLNLIANILLEEAGSFRLLACGLGRQWGPDTLICVRARRPIMDAPPPLPWLDGNMLSILIVQPTLSCVAVPPIGRSHQPHHVRSAQIVADGHIVMDSYTNKSNYVLTVCRCTLSNEPEHLVLPGTHSNTIVRFGQLPDGRMISASRDGTLKIRPLLGSDEGQVTTLKVHCGKPIVDMLIMSGSRCVTSSVDHTLAVWDLSWQAEELCVAIVTDIPHVCGALHRLNETRFLSDSEPNILLVWQLTDSGVTCTTEFDYDGPIRLCSGEKRTGREHHLTAPNDLSAELLLPYQKPDWILPIRCQPDDCIVVIGDPALRLCHPIVQNSGPKRARIMAPNSSARVSRNIPICPAEPRLWPPPKQFYSFGLLPDGRLVSADRDGTLYAYNPQRTNAMTVQGVRLGNIFSNLPAKYKAASLSVDSAISMGDGRLLASVGMAGWKTLFFACDPYGQSGTPGTPGTPGTQGSASSTQERLDHVSS